MTNNEMPDINKRFLEMDNGEIAEGPGSEDIATGNEVAGEDLAHGMGEAPEMKPDAFVATEDKPQTH